MPRKDLVFRKPDGTTIKKPLQRAHIAESLDEVSLASAWADREDIADIEPKETQWEVLVVNPAGGYYFAGPIRDIVHQSDDAEYKFVVDSPERFAMDAKPGPIDDTYSGVTDRSIVRDAVDDTPQLSRGTIQNLDSGLSFSFNHATNALKIRRVRETARGETFYNYDYTVDYVNQLGTDHGAASGDPIRVGPVDGNVTEFRVVESGGKGQRATHLRVIGKGSAYEDVVADAYSAGDRKIWGRYTLRETADSSTLRKWGKSILAELHEEWLEARAVIVGPDVELGDSLHVYYPEEDIDTDLRVIEIRREITARGVEQEVTLSNRTRMRREEIERMSEELAEERRRGAAGGSTVSYYAGDVTEDDAGVKNPILAIDDPGVEYHPATDAWYVFGGEVDYYQPVSDKAVLKIPNDGSAQRISTPLNRRLNTMATVALGDYIYLNTNPVQRYDPVADTVTDLDAIPADHETYAAIFAYNGDIYTFADRAATTNTHLWKWNGSSWNETPGEYPGSTSETAYVIGDTVWLVQYYGYVTTYDFTTNTYDDTHANVVTGSNWGEEFAPNTNTHHVTSGGKLLLVANEAAPQVLAYDTTTETTEFLAAFPQNLYFGFGAASDGSKIAGIGGQDYQGNAAATSAAYFITDGT